LRGAAISALSGVDLMTKGGERSVRAIMLKDRVLVVGFLAALAAGAAVCAGGAAWMRSVATLTSPSYAAAAVPTASPDEAVRPLQEGRQDLRDFFASVGFLGEFELVSAARDDGLGRRYYQARVDAADVPLLCERLLGGWTRGRFNRTVYQNGPTGGLPRSRNIPKWWSTKTPPGADHLMLAHNRNPNWYVVLEDGGAVCLMWVGR
jgi:hypothetical protein